VAGQDGAASEVLSFRTPLRGYAFAAVPPPAEASLEQGEPVLLLREPQNPADPLAVGIWLMHAGRARWRVGYLDRTVAARIAPRLDAGAQVLGTLDGWVEEPQGRWRRPLLALTVRGPGLAGATDDGAADPGRTVDGGGRRRLGRMQPGVARRRVLKRQR
jgi:hypothetical protein